MTITIISLFVFAFAAPALCRGSGRGWLLALLPFSRARFFSPPLAPLVLAPSFARACPGCRALGLSFAFNLDGLSLLFNLLITIVGGFVLVYACAYLHGEPRLGRFYFWMLIFMGSMLGMVLADNLFLLFVFWELTSLSSYFLIGFNHHQETARASALQALLVTGAGGLACWPGWCCWATRREATSCRCC